MIGRIFQFAKKIHPNIKKQLRFTAWMCKSEVRFLLLPCPVVRFYNKNKVDTESQNSSICLIAWATDVWGTGKSLGTVKQQRRLPAAQPESPWLLPAWGTWQRQVTRAMTRHESRKDRCRVEMGKNSSMVCARGATWSTRKAYGFIMDSIYGGFSRLWSSGFL
jgi:hypothetical protein